MKVSRLEIFGFKSFVEKIVLPVDQGITAIVGPNGCGKSNIVDALRWVFGETRASQLRGALLEDVIFNGTETMRPLGLAEVSIVISTDKDNLFEEIAQSRPKILAALPNAEEEASGQPLLEAEAESLSDTQVMGERDENGRPKLVVIPGALYNKSSIHGSAHTADLASAAECSETIENSAEQILQAQDGEAAVTLIDKDISSEEEAMPNGGDAPALGAVAEDLNEDPALARLGWLKLTREVEVTRRLYRSGESEFFINKVACRLRDIKDVFRLLGLGARSYTLVAQGEVSRIITAKPEERRLMIEEAAGVSGVRERLAAAVRRLDDTKANILRMEDLLTEVSRQVNSLKVQATRARNREELKERLQFLELSIFADGLRFFGQQKSQASLELEEARLGEEQSNADLEELLLQEEQTQKELVELNARGDQLNQQLRSLEAQFAAYQGKRSAVESQVSAFAQQTQSKADQIKDYEGRFYSLTSQLENAEDELAQFESTALQIQEQIASLEHSSEHELIEASSTLERARAEAQRVSEEFQSARTAQSAIEARLEAVNEQIATLGQTAAILETAPQLADAVSGLVPLAQLVQCSSEYVKALEVVLGKFSSYQVCEDAKQFAQKLLGCGDLASIPVTLQTLSLSARGSNLNGFDVATVPFPPLLSLLQVDGRAKELFAGLLGGVFVCDSIGEALSFMFERELPSAFQFVTKNGELLSSERVEVYRQQGGLVELYARRRSLASDSEDISALIAEKSAARDSTQAILRDAESLQELALQRSLENQHQIRQLSTEVGGVKGKIEVLHRLRNQRADEQGSIESQLERGREEHQQLSSALSACRLQLDELSAFDEEGLRSEIDSIAEQLEQVQESGRTVIDSLDERSKQRDRARQQFEHFSSARSRLEFSIEKIALEEQSINDKLVAYYPEVSVDAVLNCSEITDQVRAEYTEEALKLRAKLVREGEVDPSSIERFEVEERRQIELQTQHKDLQDAERKLGETVEQLALLARKQFLETFEVVQKNFGRLIPRVFGGGFGAIELENLEDPFEGGLDITVRPPGKRPKSIELLSGGERALCAIALIFSMFLHRPSPLCVLDEVDAPLDEANLRRYLGMVREMASVTQFLMITHNKESMGSADRLVGVTQEQPGASRVVTVSLEQAQTHAAA